MQYSRAREHPRYGALAPSERGWAGVSPGVEIWDVEWRPERDPHARRFTPTSPAVVFPSVGCYRRSAGRAVDIGTPAAAVVYAPGVEYRVSHPRGRLPVRATRLLFTEDGFETSGLSASGALAAMRRKQGGAFMTSPRTHLLHRLALGAAARDAERAPELVAELCESIVLDAGDAPGPSASRYTRAVALDAQEVIAAHWRERLTLGDLAEEVGCSMWHLARAFKSAAGMTVHAYLRGVRARHAAERIASGERDLTRLALECGFSSHSHMTSAVKRHFGRTPSDLRRLFAGAR